MNRAIFLDKDGCLIINYPYQLRPIEFQPRVLAGLRPLQEAGFLLIGVSNQSGIARGYYTEEELCEQLEEIRSRLKHNGILLVDFLYCPHHPEGTVPPYVLDCPDRKPQPGMLLIAAERWEIDLSRSYMIGDTLNDVEAGKRAGSRGILFDTGGKTERTAGPYRTPDFTSAFFGEIAEYILSDIPPHARLP